MPRSGLQNCMPGFLLASVLIMNVGISGCSGVPVETSIEHVEILAEVVAVSPLPTKETAQRKRWSVEMRVLRIIHGKPEVKSGETLTVQVHSVVKAFGEDVDTVKGKTFRVTYLDAFSKDYTGNIAIDPS